MREARAGGSRSGSMLVARRHSWSMIQAATRLNRPIRMCPTRSPRSKSPASAQPAAMATAKTSVPTSTIMLTIVIRLRVFTEPNLFGVPGILATALA